MKSRMIPDMRKWQHLWSSLILNMQIMYKITQYLLPYTDLLNHKIKFTYPYLFNVILWTVNKWTNGDYHLELQERDNKK